MAKIYEALKRAEQERKRKAGGGVPDDAVSGRGSLDPALEAPPSAKPGSGGRGWKWRSAASAPSGDSYAEYNKCRISMLRPDSYVAEQFRTLRTRIDTLASQRPLKSIAIMSPNAGDGKTTAAVNLAAVTAMGMDQRVALVDCNLRDPSVTRVLGLEPETGLAEILMGEATIEDALLRIDDPGFDVIPVRAIPANPSELIGSAAMRHFMESVIQRYDRVFVDTPSALGLPDARAICEICDGMLVVVRAGETPVEDVQFSLDLVDRRRVLGVILNDDDSSGRVAELV